MTEAQSEPVPETPVEPTPAPAPAAEETVIVSFCRRADPFLKRSPLVCLTFPRSSLPQDAAAAAAEQKCVDVVSEAATPEICELPCQMQLGSTVQTLNSRPRSDRTFPEEDVTCN